jgi:hypothetical protein
MDELPALIHAPDLEELVPLPFLPYPVGIDDGVRRVDVGIVPPSKLYRATRHQPEELRDVGQPTFVKRRWTYNYPPVAS